MDLAVMRPIANPNEGRPKAWAGRIVCVLALGAILAGCVAPPSDQAAPAAPVTAMPTSDPLISFLSGATAPAAAAPPVQQPPSGNAVLEPYRATLDRILGAQSQPQAVGSSRAPAAAPSARFRIVRSYAAASGAECREVEEASGASVERLRLVCLEPNGVWREARPLLSGLSQRP